MITVNRLPSWFNYVDLCDEGGLVPAICRSIDGRRCDECNRAWGEIQTADGPDERGYVHVRGRIGASLIDTVLCPACFDDMLGGDGDLRTDLASTTESSVRPLTTRKSGNEPRRNTTRPGA